MKNTIKLDNPVQINGKSYNELTYDISEITAQAFAISIHALCEEGDSKNRDKISIFKQIIQHSARI